MSYPDGVSMNAFEVTFGDRLRRARIALGMDQRTFADGLSIHHGTVSRYERDGGSPEDPATRRLAALVQNRYGVSEEWLLTGIRQVTREWLSRILRSLLRAPGILRNTHTVPCKKAVCVRGRTPAR